MPPVAYAVRKYSADGGEHWAIAEVSGEFPGSPVDLRFAFRFNGEGRITALTIRP